MGLFSKKKNQNNSDLLSKQGLIGYFQNNLKNPTEENVLKAVQAMAKPDKDLQHLTKEGELPWGWLSTNKAFTDKVQQEYSHFLNKWLASKKESPLKQYEALQSFVTYLHDVKSLCISKGECFTFWYFNVLTSYDYITQREKELKELKANFDTLQNAWEKRKTELPGIENRILKMIGENDGILQSDLVKMFDVSVQPDVKEKLYFMDKGCKIKRIKNGKSYSLHLLNKI